MRSISKLALATVGSLTLSLGMVANVQEAHATQIRLGDNLVRNGDFENYKFDGDFAILSTKKNGDKITTWANFNENDNQPTHGWYTDAQDGLIEIQTSALYNNNNFKDKTRGNYAELNSNGPSMLFQQFSVDAGMYQLAFDHSGREGRDTIGFSILDVTGLDFNIATDDIGNILNDNSRLFSGTNEADALTWENVTTDLIKIDGSRELVLLFEPISYTDRKGVSDDKKGTFGNFVDNVSFKKVQDIPEPASVLGLLALGAFGTISSLKRKHLGTGN
jgi:hypothetical protein